MKIVIWARVSSREQREGYSIDAQLRACRGKAEKCGWQVAREFVVAESAKRGAEREAFHEMLRWVKQQARRLGLKAVLSHKLDRACRNMRDAVRLQELEDECGVQLAFVENDFGPGAAGALSFNVMAAVSQYYSDNLRTEVLKGMEERVRQGWPPGHAPFGYLNVSNRAEPVIPHPDKARSLVRIFELFATGQYTFDSLATKLYDEGHFYQPSQPRFTRCGLSHILNNRFYIGELARHGAVYRGAYKLVLDPQLFTACQDVLRGRNRRCAGSPDLLFAGGLFRCACCGQSMTGERIRRSRPHGPPKEHIYYRCANNHRPTDHPIVRWREADVEAAIVRELASIRLPDEETIAWFRDTFQAALSDTAGQAAAQRRSLGQRLAELEAMKQRLLNTYLAGTIDEPTFTQRQTALCRETEEVQQQLAQAERLPPEQVAVATTLFDFSQSLVAIWQRSNAQAKREIINAVSLNREIGATTIVIPKRKPFDLLAEWPKSEDGRDGEI